MSANSKIEWTDHTFNPWIGCTKVSPGCAHCYAESYDKRTSGGKHWGKGAPRRRTTESYWKQAIKWNNDILEIEFTRPRVFPSLCDWLDPEVPIEWLADFLQLIHDTPNLDWLLLTKRPEKFKDRLILAVAEIASRNPMNTDLFGWARDWMIEIPPHNVWLGTSVEDQLRADERIPILLQTPAAIRFLSCEPLLGPLNIHRHLAPGLIDDAVIVRPAIDWVIVGGESGPKARPCNIGWIRNIVLECKAASVPVFVKQLGAVPGFKFEDEEERGNSCPSYHHYDEQACLFIKSMDDRKGGDPDEWPEDLRIREFPKQEAVAA